MIGLGVETSLAQQPTLTLLQPPAGRGNLRTPWLWGNGLGVAATSSPQGGFQPFLPTVVPLSGAGSTLPLPAGAQSGPGGPASFDGSTVIGQARLGGPGIGSSPAVRWVGGAPSVIPVPADLNAGSGITALPGGVSDDGAVVVGNARDGLDQQRHWVWTQALGTVSIPGGPVWTPRVSRNGAFATGVAEGPAIGGIGASGGWLWNRASNSVLTLPAAPGRRIRPGVVSDTGTVFGMSQDEASGLSTVFSWNQADGYRLLPPPPGTSSHDVQVTAISADGRTLAGVRLFIDSTEGWVRTPEGQYLSLTQMLIASGLAPNSFWLPSITSLSADGFRIAGEYVRTSDGFNQPFVLAIPAPGSAAIVMSISLALARRRRGGAC